MYNIVRVAKIKTTIQQSNAENHNFRKNPNIKNVDYSRSERNIYLVGNGNEDLQKIFLDKKEELKFRYEKDKSVKFYEFVISASPEFFNGLKRREIKKYFEDNLDILKEHFLKVEGSVVSAVIHMDEKTPHMHIIGIPLVKDEKKEIKRGKDKGKIIEGEFFSLSHERILGKRKDYRNLQDTFNTELKNRGYDLERGKKNTGIKHTDLKEYNKQIQDFKELKEDKIDIEKELLEFEELNKVQQFFRIKSLVPALIRNVKRLKKLTKLFKHIKQLNEKLNQQNEELKNRLDNQQITKAEIEKQQTDKMKKVFMQKLKNEQDKQEGNISRLKYKISNLEEEKRQKDGEKAVLEHRLEELRQKNKEQQKDLETFEFYEKFVWHKIEKDEISEEEVQKFYNEHNEQLKQEKNNSRAYKF